MPSHDLKCEVAGAVRVGIIALGFVAFTGPAVMILSSPEAYAREDGEKSGRKSGDDKGGDRVGAKVADRKAATGTTGVRIFRGLVGGDGAGVSIQRVPTNAGAASSPARANANTGPGLARTSQGTGAGPKAAFATAPATASTAGVGIGNYPATAGPTGTAVGFGGDSFASGSVSVGFGGGSDGRSDDSNTISGQGGTGGSDIPSAFETLSRAQQARVMQRCKEVVARPALAEQNQLTICQVLLAMAKP